MVRVRERSPEEPHRIILLCNPKNKRSSIKNVIFQPWKRNIITTFMHFFNKMYWKAFDWSIKMLQVNS